MSQTKQTPSGEVTDGNQFAVEKLEVDKDDSGGYSHAREQYTRQEWFTGATGTVLWSELASQSDGDRDVSDSDGELVGIEIFGWWVNDDDAWGQSRRGYGHVYGKTTTLAVVERDETTESGFAESGSGKAYKFSAVKNENGDWVSLSGGFAPKTGVTLFAGVGDPDAVDKERVRRRDGLARDDDGRVEYDSDFDFDAALSAAQDRVEAEQNPQHEYIEDLTDEFGGTPGVAALVAFGKGEDLLEAEYGRELDAEEKEALAVTATNAIAKMINGADDSEAIRELLNDDEE